MRPITIVLLVLALLPTAPAQAETAASAAKSSRLAFFLSLADPGLRELYTGATKRGIGFMAAEALTWITYIHWRDKGNDLKADFREFADQHWDEGRYRAWQAYNASLGYPYTETEILPIKAEDAQQYYEMIGKYAQFVFGWDDVTAELTTEFETMRGLSERRLAYEVKRNESNKYLKRASVVVGLAVLNRVVSAIHASVHARSLQASSSSRRIRLDIAPMDAHGRPSMTASLSVRF